MLGSSCIHPHRTSHSSNLLSSLLLLSAVSGALALPTSCVPQQAAGLTILDTRDPAFVTNLSLSPVADADRNPYLQRGHDQQFTIESCGESLRISAEFNGTTGCLTVPQGVGIVTLLPCADDAATQGWSVDSANQVHFVGDGDEYHVAFGFLGGNQVVSEIHTTPFPEYEVYFFAA